MNQLNENVNQQQRKKINDINCKIIEKRRNACGFL